MRIIKSFLPIALLLPLLCQAQGTITTIAGLGNTLNHNDDSVSAMSVSLCSPDKGVMDRNGNYYFIDAGHSIVRKIDANGFLTDVAGVGSAGYSGDGWKATHATLNAPSDVAVDKAGNVFIADHYNARVRKIDAVTGYISTVAGNGTDMYTLQDNIPATSACIGRPHSIAVDSSGNLYIAGNSHISKVDQNGMLTIFAGDGFDKDGVHRLDANVGFPWAMCFDKWQNLYYIFAYNEIKKIDAQTGMVSHVAGVSGNFGDWEYNGNYIPAAVAQISPRDIDADSDGNIVIADRSNFRIRMVNVTTGWIVTLAGTGQEGFAGDGGNAVEAKFSYASGVCVDSCNNIYVADAANGRIRKITYPICGRALSVGEVNEVAEFSVFPNPARAELTIKSSSKISSVSIVDVTGRTVLQRTVNSEQMIVDVSSLTSGIYFVRVGDKVVKFVRE